MTLQSELTSRLLEIPDVEPVELGRSKMFVCGSKEIVRLREDGAIDIRLTHPLISALRMSEDETAPGWVQMTVKQQTDLPAVIALVQRAVHTAKLVS